MTKSTAKPHLRMTKLLTVVMGSCILLSPGVLMADEAAFLAIYEPFIEKYKTLADEVERASWEARKTGSPDAFKKKKAARLAMVKLLSNADLYSAVIAMRGDGTITDPFVARLARVMEETFLPVQTDRAAVEKEVELEIFFEQTLRNHRIRVDGKELTTGEIRRILRTTTDSKKAERVWKAYMKLGKELDPKVRELVDVRNRIGDKQGHYFRYRLYLARFASKNFYRFFNLLKQDMHAPYFETKKEIDKALAAKFGIDVSELRPWHYGDLYFRDAPVTAVSDLDHLFEKTDLVSLARGYLNGIGLPCDNIIKRSEISTTPGAAVFPYRVGFDSAGKARVACDVEPTALGAEDLFQSLAKAVYRENMKSDVPVLLRRPPYRTIDECIGSFAGSVVRNPEFLKNVLHVDPKELQKLEETAKRTMRWRAFIRASWAQLLMRFELKMYGASTRDYPNEWATFVEENQGITLPDGEFRYGFALVPEILLRPVSHHCTLMGDLLAEQLNVYLLREVLEEDTEQRPSFAGKPKVGAFFRDRLMAPADLYHWEQLVRERIGGSFTKDFYLRRIFGIEPTPVAKPTLHKPVRLDPDK